MVQKQAGWGKASVATEGRWSIRTRLLVEGRTRDLAMFNVVIRTIA
jgi:hypothetical protein